MISDRHRTPFNIGTAIELGGFTIIEATPLIAGLQDGFENPQIAIKEIIKWTGGQPFLTQKLCKLAIDNAHKNIDLPVLESQVKWIEELVTKNIIDRWESQDEPEHLRTIRDRILRDEQKANRLLSLIEQILKNDFILADDSLEQRDLLLSNLVVKDNGRLIFRNRIYNIFSIQVG